MKFQQGFTLIELIMVMLMLGVLAVFVAPRMVGPSAFNVRGFHDETLAYLRYAQKSAVAQRRTVCVAFGVDSVTLTLASAPQSFSCDTALAGPRGEAQAKVTAKSGASFFSSAAPADFRFDALGQPVSASGLAVGKQTITFADAGAPIWVESLTGYVHD